MRLTEFRRACCDIKTWIQCWSQNVATCQPGWGQNTWIVQLLLDWMAQLMTVEHDHFVWVSYTRKYFSTILQMWVMSNWTISYNETCLPSQPSAILVFPVAVDVVLRVGGDACGVTAERDGAKSATDQTAMWNTQVCNQIVTLARIS